MYYADQNASTQGLGNLTHFVQSKPGAGLLSRCCSGLNHGYEGDLIPALALEDINVQHILAGHSYHDRVTLYSGGTKSIFVEQCSNVSTLSTLLQVVYYCGMLHPNKSISIPQQWYEGLGQVFVLTCNFIIS